MEKRGGGGGEAGKETTTNARCSGTEGRGLDMVMICGGRLWGIGALLLL